MQGIRDRVGASIELVRKIARVLKTELSGSLRIPSRMRSRIKYFARFVPTVFHGKRSNLVLNSAVLHGLEQELDTNAVFYEAFHGQGALCNPEAIFRFLVTSPAYSHLHHYWSLKNEESGQQIRSEFAGHPKVTFLETGSKEYFVQLERSKYLINNSTFPPRFIKRTGQIYLNTWHGTPFKKMLYDTPAGAYSASNTLKNMMASDYLLSQNDHMSQVMYRHAFGLEDLFKGTVIEDGYPRTDHQFFSEGLRLEKAEVLSEFGIHIGSSRVILYAPTWRGNDLNNPTDDVDRLVKEVTQLRQGLVGQDVKILLRIHQFLYPQAANRSELVGMIIPNEVPANICLGLADHLVTDFSSIFFDYLSLERPIHFYVPDLTEYSRDRGLYFKLEELPGAVSETINDLVLDIQRAITDESYETVSVISSSNFTQHDDGNVTERIVSYVFGGTEIPDEKRAQISSGRKTMLMFPGGFLPNGITTSALNFLSQIDHDAYKVLVILKADARREFVARINSRAQVYFEPGSIVRNRKEQNHWARFSSLGGKTAPELAEDVRRTFVREAQRLFSGYEFDAVLDFDGYSGHWARVLGNAVGKVKAIWQHNDLQADSNRNVDGVFPHKTNLELVFRAYGRFDRLVSVSEPLSRINAAKLREFSASDKFVFVENFIDEATILATARGPKITPEHTVSSNPLRGELSKDVAQLRNLYSPEVLEREFDRQKICEKFSAPGQITFSFAGRLSPEKGLDLLLEAFAIVAERAEKARLLIIGDGPEKQRLKRLSQDLGISRRVVFTGHQSFGMALVDQSDCFVMSSKHEGQPMVLLEAQVLGKPIVSSEFPAIEGALRSGNGLVTPRDKESLAQGMLDFLEGKVLHHDFSAIDYNSNVRQQLAVILESGPLKESEYV